MVVGLIETCLLSKSVRHFVSSAKVLSLNSKIAQAESPYGIFLGPSLCSNIDSFTISSFGIKRGGCLGTKHVNFKFFVGVGR